MRPGGVRNEDGRRKSVCDRIRSPRHDRCGNKALRSGGHICRCPRLVILSILLLCACLSGCGYAAAKNEPQLKREGFFFNTIIQIQIYDSTDAALLDGCMERCARYEDLFSAHKEGTDIDRINRAGSRPVTVDPETASLLRAAKEFAALSEGTFDVTIGGVTALWNFTGDPPGPAPAASAVREALAHVDCNALRIEGNTVTLTDPAARLDPGAVAKGYVADRLKEYLVENGVRSALINLGGNVLLVGAKPDGSAFRTGVQKPFGGAGEYVTVLEETDKSIVTSGVYERYYEEDGVRFHHLLDARSGFPAETGLSGVTVVSESSLQGDALSTICFLLGKEKASSLIQGMEDITVYFLSTDGEMTRVDGTQG